MAPILLKGGTVLQHDADNNVSANKVDVLIEGNVIKQIEKNIDPTSSTEVLDCTNKIIAPGFVDTHHHVWQTQLKGRHADELLGPYMFTGNFTSSLFSPDDVLWGEIGGAMEAVDSGTTTVVDHAHMTYSEAHVRAGVAGFEASGLRGFFCLAPVMRVKNWTPKFELEEEMLPSWFKEVADKLPKEAPFTDGLMQPGMTFDIQGNVSKEVLVELFEKARKDGYKLFTAHALRGMINFPQVPPLAEKSLLGPDCLFSHLNNPTKEDIDLLNTHGGYFSTTPSTELQMGHGLLTWTVEGLKDRASMGVDCHTITGGSMAVEMRLALQNARALYNEEMLQKKVPYYPLPYKAQDVFNLGTIMGAKAVNMADKIGSIAVGKYADLVVWDGLSPSMIAAAEHDPVVAIVIHSTVRDIDAVIINGVFRKKDSKLLPVSVKDTSGSKSSHEWKDIAVKLLKSREKIQEKASKLDYYQAMKDLGWA